MIRTLAVTTSLVLSALPVLAAETPVKTLDEINIEGELRLPQVLFITSRESQRPLDFLRLYAGPDAAAVCEAVAEPGALRVDTPSAAVTPVPPTVSDETASETSIETHEETLNPSKEDSP